MSAVDIIKAMQELKNEGCLNESQIYSGGNSMDSQRYYTAKPAGMVRESTVTLNQLYSQQRPDSRDRIYDYGTMIWDKPFEVGTIGYHKLDILLCSQYQVDHIEELVDRLKESQKEILDKYINDSNLSNHILVLDNGYIVDGNHRALAAALSKRPMKFIDIGEEEDLTESIGDIDIQFKPVIAGSNYRYSFQAFIDGNRVAYGEVKKDNKYDDDNSASVQDIVVAEKYRRKGIASKIYDEIERQLNFKLHPSDDLTDMGREFWASRDTLEEEDNGVIYYFAYGMLTDPVIMENVELVGVGKLANHKLMLYEYANVEPDNEHDTLGCLWIIDRRMLKELDQIEGYPTLYGRQKYNIVCDGLTYSAEVYIMTDRAREKLQDTMPTQDYVDSIVNGYNHAGIPLNQLKMAVDEVNDRFLSEASPDTLGGSFTDDLIESKSWLCEKLSKGLKGKNAGTIYAIGSWYGNIGIYLQQYDIKFDKLVLIETDEQKLQDSKKLLEPLYDEGKLILLHQDANDVVFDKPGIVINTSCNETGPVFLTKVPDNMLVVLQARNENEEELISTDSLEELIEYFPLKTVYYSGEKHLSDPETEYDRYMVIGRAGKQLDETVSTGQGGGSAGIGGGSMVGGPETYEQEYDKFKSRGQRRIRVNFESVERIDELFDRPYDYNEKKVTDSLTSYTFKTDKGIDYKVRIFSSPTSGVTKVEFSSKGDISVTNTRDEFKVFSTVLKIIADYVNSHDVETIYFQGDTNEPSRIKLYTTMVKQISNILPDYRFSEIIPGRQLTSFVIKRTTDGDIHEPLE